MNSSYSAKVTRESFGTNKYTGGMQKDLDNIISWETELEEDISYYSENENLIELSVINKKEKVYQKIKKKSADKKTKLTQFIFELS